MEELAFLPAREWLARLRSGALGALEATDYCIARIEALDPAINAVVARDFERARKQARLADASPARGTPAGALRGLPITIKDSLETAELPTTSGAAHLRAHRAPRNAVAVQRLLDAGAIVLGKTNLPRLAGDWQTYNEIYGRTNNPWDLERTAGGSSGGSAAAIAAGLVPLETGSDIAGSIRTPAHYCGVYGHKPTHGVVPMRGHIPGTPGTYSEPDLAVIGPIARSASDLALALEVIAGPDALDAPGWTLQLPPPRAERLQDFRVGFWLDDPSCPLDSRVRTELERTLEALRPHVQLTDIGRPFALRDITPHYIQLLLGVMAPSLPHSVRRGARLLSALHGLAERLGRPVDAVTASHVRGVVQSHDAWARVNEARQRLRWRCHELFQQIDVLLMPVVPTTAFRHQTDVPFARRRLLVDGVARPYLDHVPWIALPTLALLPATSAPVGIASDGLPVNLQIVGPALGDRTTIRFAELLAGVRGGFVPPRKAPHAQCATACSGPFGRRASHTAPIEAIISTAAQA